MRNRNGVRAIRPYLYVLPIILFAVGFVYYPFLKTFLYSFSTVNVKGEITGFAGLDNYAYLFGRREFQAALRNTLVLTAVNVPITLLIASFLASLCVKERPLSPVYETMFALPMAISMAAIALVFRVLLNPTVGFVNHALNLSIGWFEDRNTALFSIVLLTVWMGIGFNFLLFLSAFRAIPAQVIEAARLDGANAAQLLFRVRLPLAVPTVVYAAATNAILALMTNGPIMILTQGGPSRATVTLIYMMYTSGYNSSNYSLAACISICTFLLALCLTLLLLRLEKKKVSYE
ncbi:MAG: sugar ABC transporter permease [Clostridia bacterium]|nr:sugar ABC transporter permease [Clostridia bacterium]